MYGYIPKLTDVMDEKQRSYITFVIIKTLLALILTGDIAFL